MWIEAAASEQVTEETWMTAVLTFRSVHWKLIFAGHGALTMQWEEYLLNILFQCL